MEKETFLTFIVENEYFAVDVKYVLEVLEHRAITRVPQAPPHILGIINFRGEILPVTDIRYKFNMPPHAEDEKSIIIVYEITKEDKTFSITATADAVKDVIEIDKDEIKPVPEVGINYDNRYISGIIKRDDKFILLLCVEKLFSINETDVAEYSEATQNQNQIL
jgi:purine-binding chemotaxis protein CheW